MKEGDYGDKCPLREVESEEMTELKPCPFCGGEGIVERDYPPSETPANDHEWVECKVCGATGPWHRVSRTHQAIIRGWNRRLKE